MSEVFEFDASVHVEAESREAAVDLILDHCMTGADIGIALRTAGRDADRIAELEAEVERLTQYETGFKQLVDDLEDDMECLPLCDSIAHEEMCPVTNPAAAWRNLREEIERLEAYIAELKADWRTQNTCIAGQHDEIRRLRKALEFYADESNWKEVVVAGVEHSLVYSDDGDIARKALEGQSDGS